MSNTTKNSYRVIKEAFELKVGDVLQGVEGGIHGFYDANSKVVNETFAKLYLGEYFELVKPTKKRFEDLKDRDECFYISNDGIVRDTVKAIDDVKSETFLTREDAEMEALRREARANQEWIPKNNETYYYIRSNGLCNYSSWTNHNFDLSKFHLGNVHKTEKDAEKWREKYFEAFFVYPFKK